MTDPTRDVVHVMQHTSGWWNVRTAGGQVLAQFPSEFQARESGRLNAQRLHADLEIHQGPGPSVHWHFDDADGMMKPT